MRIGEFVELAEVSEKTARWLYDNVFAVDGRKRSNHRVYTQDDVSYVISRKAENFSYFEEVDIVNIGKYYITNSGKVFIGDRGFVEELKYDESSGYRRVGMTIDGVRKKYKVARLVATHFIKNEGNKPTVNHIDGDKLNDDYKNLEWATVSENTQHAYDLGLAKNDSGAEDSQSIPLEMFDNSGKKIGEFGSIREAVRETGMTLGYIYNQAVRGAKQGTQGVYFNFK